MPSIRKRLKDLTGSRYGNLIAIYRVSMDKHGRSIWLCQCDCGKTSEVMIGNLTSGNSTSCGCKKGKWKHGGHGSPAYRSWSHMLTRCNNRKHGGYRSYGGRGITVIPRWRDFSEFVKDMGQPPGDGRFSLDRIDNNKGYSPENCRWATRVQQARNRSDTRMITFRGETKCLAEWVATEGGYGVYQQLVNARLALGWSLSLALKTPPKKRQCRSICCAEGNR